jgi:hypothetical protein
VNFYFLSLSLTATQNNPHVCFIKLGNLLRSNWPCQQHEINCKVLRFINFLNVKTKTFTGAEHAQTRANRFIKSHCTLKLLSQQHASDASCRHKDRAGYVLWIGLCTIHVLVDRSVCHQFGFWEAKLDSYTELQIRCSAWTHGCLGGRVVPKRSPQFHYL